MHAQQHFKLIEAYHKRMIEYSENEYNVNFDIFYLKDIYPKFTFISCSQFLQIARHLSTVFTINNFEVAIMKINLQSLSEKEPTFQTATIADSLLQNFINEFKTHPEFFNKLVNFIMMFLNAKVV